MYKVTFYPPVERPSISHPAVDYAPETCNPLLCLSQGSVPDRTAQYAVDATDFIGNQHRVDNICRMMKQNCQQVDVTSSNE